jgi:hypothetical protein
MNFFFWQYMNFSFINQIQSKILRYSCGLFSVGKLHIPSSIIRLRKNSWVMLITHSQTHSHWHTHIHWSTSSILFNALPVDLLNRLLVFFFQFYFYDNWSVSPPLPITQFLKSSP